jgi:hypothetical protein
MTKFHVEFDYESDDGLSGWSSPANAENFTVKQVVPPFVPGYYMDYTCGAVRLIITEDELSKIHNLWHQPRLRRVEVKDVESGAIYSG